MKRSRFYAMIDEVERTVLNPKTAEKDECMEWIERAKLYADRIDPSKGSPPRLPPPEERKFSWRA